MAGKLPGRALDSNTSVTVNSISFGSNLAINTSAISLGNSTTNTTVNSSVITVGANVSVNTSTITLGNSTVNTVIHTTGFTGNGAGLHTVNAAALQGNSVSDILVSANTAANTLASAAYSNATTYASNANNISTGYLDTARLPATVNVSTAINVGANVNINTSTISIGNSTVNTTIQAGNVNLQGTQLTVGNVVIGGEVTDRLSVGNSTVNTVITPATITINGVNVNTAITSNAATAYSNATSYADTKAATAYSNATSYADTKAGDAFTNAASRADAAYSNAIAYSGNAAQAYSNATTFASNATNISSGTLNTARLPATISIATALVVGNSTVNTVINSSSIGTANGNFGDVVITGNLTVQGTTTEASVGTLNVGDSFIVLNNDLAATNAPTANAGLTVNRGSSANVRFQWSESNDRWDLGNTYVSGNLNVTGDVQIDGNLTISGTSVTINAASLAVEDNMIYLNNGSQVTNPDLGFAGNYNDGSYKHAGFFRDASDGVWKVFDSYTPEPDASAYIDTTNNTFRIASFQANVITANSLSGNGASVTSVDAATVGGNTASTLRTYSDTVAATAFSNAASRADSAYSNAVSYAATIAGTAYSNAASYADTKAATAFSNAASRADSAYSNAVSYAATIAGTAYSNAISYSGNAALAYANAIAYSANATNLSSGTVAFARLPALYLGTTQIQSSSAAQAVSGITTLATGNTTITGFANVTSTIQANGLATFTYNAGNSGWSNYQIDAAPASGGAYIRANRANNTTGEVGFTWATAGACTWINYVGTSSTTLGWYQGVSTVMTLTTAGALTTNTFATSSNTATFGTAAYVVANGNVGVGTASPTAKLQVESGEIRIVSAGAINTHLNYQNGGDNYISYGNAGATYFRNSSSTLVSFFGNGHVGIGTTSPTGKLTISSVTLSQSNSALDINASGSGTYQRGIRVLNSSMGNGDGIMVQVGKADNTRNAGQMVFNHVSDASTSNYIEFGLYAVDKILNIVGTGRVGIGNTAPGHALDVNGAIRSGAYFVSAVTSSGSGDSNAPYRFETDYSAWASHWAGSPGSNNGWGLFWAGNSGAQYGTNGTGGPGNIWSNSSNPNEAVFVGNGSTDWTVALNSGNTWQKGSCYVAGDVYSSYSDLRLKNIISGVENALEKICQIDTIYYKSNELAKSLGVTDDKLKLGTTSQSVKKVFPELIAQSPVNAEYDTVQYDRLVVPLIAAMKEQQAMINELKEEIKLLKQKVCS